MSAPVVGAVLNQSKARLGARLVLLSLAEAAHIDGVTWLDQESVAALSLLSEREVRRSMRELEEMGELETRKAQRGRRRINVYRVTLPGVAEPLYDKLPFALTEPFTTGQIVRSPDESPESDDRTSTTVTTGHPVSRVVEEPEPSTEPSEEKTPSSLEGAVDWKLVGDPPKLVKVNGRNLAFDTLCEVAHVQPDSPRASQVAVALNGRRREGRLAEPGINRLFWVEAARHFNTTLDAIRERAEANPAGYQETLAEAIRRRAALYEQRLPAGAMLTPSALAKWWLDLELLPSAGGLTPEGIAHIGRQHEERMRAAS